MGKVIGLVATESKKKLVGELKPTAVFDTDEQMKPVAEIDKALKKTKKSEKKDK